MIFSYPNLLSCGSEVILSDFSLAIMLLWRIQPFSAISALLLDICEESSHSQLFQSGYRAVIESLSVSSGYHYLLQLCCYVSVENPVILSYYSLAAAQPRSRSQPIQAITIYCSFAAMLR